MYFAVQKKSLFEFRLLGILGKSSFNTLSSHFINSYHLTTYILCSQLRFGFLRFFHSIDSIVVSLCAQYLRANGLRVECDGDLFVHFILSFIWLVKSHVPLEIVCSTSLFCDLPTVVDLYRSHH